MDSHTDYFHHLPDEVIQLIFSRITDCTTLVQCMSVSKAFRQQAVSIPSLSIVCPGSFSTYDERLLKIYTMVKAFKNLQSLVVRVGQPKEEPPSWARCMRYAEIGGSVEKFMFMAAKCGDFSELDATLLGLDGTVVKRQGKVWNGSNSATPLEAMVHTDMDTQECIETSNNTNSMGEVDNGNTEAWSDIESDEEGGQRGLPKSSDREQKEQENRSLYSRLAPFDASFLSELGQRKPLSQLSLRQVIAPSNDVLKRMLPVIHFAIVQGLNELRDSLPGFVAMFAELRSFLLVDMAESITVFMREHHIQELKALYLRDWDGTATQVKEALKVEPFFSGLGLGRGEDQVKCSSGKVEEEVPTVASKVSRGCTEVLDSRLAKCTEEVGDSDENGCVSDNEKQGGDTLGITQMPKVEVQKSKDVVNEGSCLRRIGSTSSSTLSTCKLPLLQSFSRKNSEAWKGKEKLSEYQDLNLQGEGRLSVSKSSHMDSGCKDYNSLASVEDPVDGSLGGRSSLPFHEDKVHSGNLITTSLAGLKDEGSDVENPYPAYPSAGEILLEPRTRLRPFKSLDNSMLYMKELDWSSQSDAELEGDGEAGVINDERGANNTHVEGLDGKLGCKVEDPGKTRENGYTRQGVRYSRDAKVDLTNKVLSKRFHRSDTMKKTDFCKSLRCSAGLRGFGSLFSNDFAEDVDSEIPTSEDVLDKKEKAALAGNVHDGSLVASSSSGVDCAKNEGLMCGVYVRTDGDGSSNREEVGNGAIEGPQQNERNDELMRDSRMLPWESHENAGERLADADAWRHVWQERVRRLRDSLRMAPAQELERTRDDLRGRPRDLLRRRHQVMEKDALSFDYTFWRAEQVSSCDYVMSDISMCIATHAAQPLGDAEKEVLSRAAIAGPLLVATVSHVNKHHNCHNL